MPYGCEREVSLILKDFSCWQSSSKATFYLFWVDWLYRLWCTWVSWYSPCTTRRNVFALVFLRSSQEIPIVQSNFLSVSLYHRHQGGYKGIDFAKVKLSHDFYPRLCSRQSSCWKQSNPEIVCKALCKLHWSFPEPASHLPPILMPTRALLRRHAVREEMTACDCSSERQRPAVKHVLYMNAKCE